MKMLLPAKREGALQQFMSGGLCGSLQGPGADQLDATVQQTVNARCQQRPHCGHVAALGKQIDDCSGWGRSVCRGYEKAHRLAVPAREPHLVGCWTIREAPVQITAVPHQSKVIACRCSLPELV